MAKLQIQQAQLVHTAYFAEPVLGLWGEGKGILQSLYNAFHPFGAGLTDIRAEGINPGDQVVSVTLGQTGIHRFRFDRLETTFFNFSESEWATFPAILAASLEWVRKASPATKIGRHQFTYTSHSRLEGEAGDACLRRIGPAAPKSGGVGQGSGAIFHWEVPDRQWTTQLLVDKSLVVPDGLFLLFYLTIGVDKVDFFDIAASGEKYFSSILKELNLDLPASNE